MRADGKYEANSYKSYLSEQMTRAQGMRLKRLSEETYQPTQYAGNLSSDEAARRIRALEAEIALADSF